MAGRDFSAELFGGSEEKTQRGRDLSAELFGKPSKERTFGEALKDIGAGAVSGIGSLVQTPGQLYGLATGNFDKTGLLGAGQDIQKYGEEMKSAGLKAREQERAQKIAQAAEKGQFSAFGTALAETLKDPALLSTFLSEQLPQMVVPLGAGKIGTAIGAARGLGAEAAVGAGTRAAIGAGAIQQGADIGEGTYTQIYQELIDKGAKPEQAKTAALNLARASGASGAVISLLAQKLPGATRLEEALAGAERKGSRLATAGRAIAGEVPSEITEEVGGKLGQNIAMRQVKPEQSLTEGLGETAAMATLGAAGLGGAAGLAGRAPSAPPPVPPIDTTTPPDTGLQTKIEETTGISRTVPEITPLSAEEAGRQRILNLQKKVDADVAANEERAAREGIAPVVPPTPERADVSKPGLNETQMPQATSREELEAKQAEIDKLRLAAGLPTGPSSKTPGIQPTVAEAVEQPRTQLVDNRPLNERAAQNRLLVMQNMLKNEGGDPASLTIVPHPTAEGKFAIQSEDKAVKLQTLTGAKNETGRARESTVTRYDETGKPYLATTETPASAGVTIDPVNAYIEIARKTNTPASMRLVNDFEAGIVTRADIEAAIDAEKKAGVPLPLNYRGNGEAWFVAPEIVKPRGNIELPEGTRLAPPIVGPERPPVEKPAAQVYAETEPPAPGTKMGQTTTETPPTVEEPPQVEPPTPTAETPKTLEEFKQRMPVAFDNTKVRSANDAGNFYSLADELSKSANPVIRRIGELGKGVSSKIKLRKPTKRLMVHGQNAAGVYRYDDDSIQMQTSHAGDEHTNAHETLHALIARAQRQPTERQKPTVQKIEVLFAHVKKELKRQGKGHYYGLTNVREFTAEAMSNPEFQYELMQISYGGRRSAWTEFTRLVAELLGITETNALTEVLNLVDKLAQTKQPRAVKTERGAVEFAQTRLPAFRRWFGKSKVVDENGDPLVVYHGTRGNFNTFKKTKEGIFFSRDPLIASKFAANSMLYTGDEALTENANVMPVYLRMEKPFDASNRANVAKVVSQLEDKRDIAAFKEGASKLDWQLLERYADFIEQAGFDGYFVNEFGENNIVVFDPKQIKSAIGNKGTYSPESEMIDAMQLPSFGKKQQAPTPTNNGQASLNNLAAMGRAEAEPEEGYKAKISKAWKESSQNPKATAEEARSAFQRFRDRIETWAFSSDAALNNKIRRAVTAANIGQEEKIGLMLNTSLSQTVHSDAVASLFLQKGGITYDKSLHKWVGQDKDANFVTLSNQLDAIAAKNGLTKPQIELIAHAAFEAKRTQSLIRFNDELSAKIAAIKAEAASKRASSPVASSALSEKAERMKDDFKFIHLSDEQIATGMEFFKLHPELNEVVKTWNEIRDNAAKVMVESGLWSESDAEFLLSNADYVPFYREDQLEQGQGPKEFIRGLKVQAKERKLKGSSKPVNDIFNNQVRWVQYSINRAVRNRSAIALADTAVAVGAATKVESQKDGANVTRIWRDGNPEYYDMADPMFMEAFNGLEAVVIPSWKWASTLANALRQSVVMYPLFSVAQVPQDSFAAMFSSGLKPQYALRIPILAVKEFIQTLRGASRSHQELKNIGAVGVRDFTSAMVRQDAEIFAGLRGPPGFLGKLKYGLNHIAMAADNAVRQAVFEAAEAQGLSKAEAFEKSFEVFNVRRKGSSKTLALASQLIPFFNAYLAAQSVAYKTITGRGISPQERTNALQTFAATTASVMTMSLLYAMMNGDDDDYLDKPAIQRDRLLMIPGTGGMSIPLRSDLFTLPKIITEHMYLLMTDKGYEDGRKFRDSMVNALGNSLLGPTAVPQAIKPIVEVAINHDFFQGRPLIGTYQQKLETERQFTDSTSEFGKFIGSSGLISPIAVDHLTRGMFGSAGGLMLYMTSAMMDSNPDAPRPSVSMRDAVATLPGMSGFLSKSYDNALKRDFYILKEEVDKAANTYNDLKNRSPDEISKFLEDEKNVARIGLQKTTNKIAENLSKIRKNISYVTNSDMSADEKQDMLKDLRDTEKEMLKGVDVKQLRELGMV